MIKYVVFLALCSTAAACQSCSQTKDEFLDYPTQPNNYRATPNYHEPKQYVLPPPIPGSSGRTTVGQTVLYRPPVSSASYQRSTDRYNPYAFENYPKNY